ncbi:hypothetical protein ES708_24966 [subsurface metagenome]
MNNLQNTRVSVRNKIKEPVCKRCGNCCKAETLLKECNEEEKRFIKMIYKLEGKNLKKTVCPFLDFKIGLAICKIYKDRPWFCREHFCDKCY